MSFLIGQSKQPVGLSSSSNLFQKIKRRKSLLAMGSLMQNYSNKNVQTSFLPGKTPFLYFITLIWKVTTFLWHLRKNYAWKFQIILPASMKNTASFVAGWGWLRIKKINNPSNEHLVRKSRDFASPLKTRGQTH